MLKDLNHLSIREVFRDNYNFPLFTLYSQGRSSINVLLILYRLYYLFYLFNSFIKIYDQSA